MADYRISLDLSQLDGLASLVTNLAMQGVQQAVEKTAMEGQSAWQASVMKAAGVWLQHKERYAASIQYRMTKPTAAVIWTDLPVADQVENGFPARDMKQMLQTSQRTRTSKKTGKKYLIIPFRHNTPGNDAHAQSMPTDVYAYAKSLSPSQVTGKTTRLSATGATVPQSTYQWGGRLPEGLRPKLKAHHTTDIYSGMVKMNTSSGGQKSSGYMTFRVMSESQTGKWLVPARPGLHIARTVATALEQRLDDNVSSSVAALIGS